MNAEIKARWTAALRSGEYAQTKGRLRRVAADLDNPAGFCCLGVLCDLAVKEGVVEAVPIENGAVMGYRAPGGDYAEGAVLPTVVQKWVGVRDGHGLAWEDDDGDLTLPVVNDQGMSFSEIADIIDQLL